MSIIETIDKYVDQGKLVELKPRPFAQNEYRKLYLEPALSDELYCESGSDEDILRLSNLEADLAVFGNSKTITPNYLKQLSPLNSGVWEIRSVEPDPQIRVFCLFAQKDILIATHLEYRDDLGNLSSDEWKAAIKQAGEFWKSLFPDFTNLKSQTVDKLYSGALDEKYF